MANKITVYWYDRKEDNREFTLVLDNNPNKSFIYPSDSSGFNEEIAETVIRNEVKDFDNLDSSILKYNNYLLHDKNVKINLTPRKPMMFIDHRGIIFKTYGGTTYRCYKADGGRVRRCFIAKKPHDSRLYIIPIKRLLHIKCRGGVKEAVYRFIGYDE